MLSGLIILGPMTLGFVIVEKINLGSSILPTEAVSSLHDSALAGGHPRPVEPSVVNIDHRTENPPGTGLKALPPCHQAGALGLSRIVQIDTSGGPEFGLQHLKGYDFLRDREVVLTFDDGPWPGSTPAILKALADQCAKATFFEIGEHASWHPEVTKQVLEAGMTVGTHTWSHKDLARGPYARDLEKAKQEIELGNSAVHDAVLAPMLHRSSVFPTCSIRRAFSLISPNGT